jgi:TPR repeat protein
MYASIALLLALPPVLFSEEPTIRDDIKNVREVLKKEGSSAPYFKKHARQRFTAWKAAAEKGSAEAQWLLGRCYFLGEGVKQDLDESVKWIRKSADQGCALAQNNLGLMHGEGTGVQKNLAMAREFYRKAADQNEAVAQWNLGCVYEDGDGVKVDFKEALKWYSKAAAQNYPAALDKVGEFHDFGRGVKEDAKEAARWFRRASDLGNGLATAKLIVLYEEGRGVEKNPDELKRLRERAQKQLGEEAEKVIRWAAVRVIAGTWRIQVKEGRERYIVTLTLNPGGKGQLYLFRPMNDEDTKGRLRVLGLRYTIERHPAGSVVLLKNCIALPKQNARIEFTVEAGKLRLKGGTALRSDEDKAGIALKGVWSSLDTDRPYGGIVVAEGSALEFTRFSQEK